MKEKFTGYSSKAPTSLTSQFPDRVGRTEAVEAYHKRIKQNTNTQLFPTGNSSFFSLFLVKYQYVSMGHLGLFFLRGIVLRGCNSSMSTRYIFVFVHECCPLPGKNWNTFGQQGCSFQRRDINCGKKKIVLYQQCYSLLQCSPLVDTAAHEA